MQGTGRRRLVLGVLSLVVAVELAVVGLLLGRVLDDGPGPTAAIATGAGARPGASALRDQTDAAEDARRARTERTRAVAELLGRRGAAVLAGDREGFLATVDPDDAVLREEQGRWFDHLADVPFASFFYEMDPSRAHPVPRSGRDKQWSPTVRLRYALEGVDAEPTLQDAVLVLRERAAGWVVSATSLPGAPDPRPNPWDWGPVVVARSDVAVALGHPGDEERLAAVLEAVTSAVPVVTREWGDGWSQRVQVVLPADREEARAIAASGLDLDQVAAVTTSVLQPGGPSLGTRVVVVPGRYAALSPLGRRVVLTHEVVHVATRDATGPATPLWLAEGYADHVAYGASGMSVRRAGAELAQEVAAGQVPDDLPDAQTFATAGDRLPAVYEAAWLAVRLVAEVTDEETLLRFYRQVGAGDPDRAEEALDRAFADVLGTTREQFVQAWQVALVRDLG